MHFECFGNATSGPFSRTGAHWYHRLDYGSQFRKKVPGVTFFPIRTFPPKRHSPPIPS